jgi:RNA 3'-terminal phosphate cyclase (ATP)
MGSNNNNSSGITIVNGSKYEGGGGLLRDIISYASILNKPVEISSIRANRPGHGGLRLEHTVAINALSILTAANVVGNSPWSRHLAFHPHASPDASGRSAICSLDKTTEGSAAIFMLAVMPYVLFSGLGPAGAFSAEALQDGIEFTIRAGTLCVKAPSFAYVQQVIVPTFRLIGIGEENLKVSQNHEQGWHTDFVKVPGRMTVWIKPLRSPLKALFLDRRGKVVRIRATVHGPKEVLDLFHDTVRKELSDALKSLSLIEVVSDALISIFPEQFHLLLVAETDSPITFLGYEQVYPQLDRYPVGLEKNLDQLFTHLTRVCIRGLYDELSHGNAVDEHLEGMLVLYQTLADGFSSVTAERNEQFVKENSELEIPFGMWNY